MCVPSATCSCNVELYEQWEWYTLADFSQQRQQYSIQNRTYSIYPPNWESNSNHSNKQEAWEKASYEKPDVRNLVAMSIYEGISCIAINTIIPRHQLRQPAGTHQIPFPLYTRRYICNKINNSYLFCGFKLQSIQSARLSIQSSELGPHPLTRQRMRPRPPPFCIKLRTALARGEGCGGLNFDDGTYTLVLYVY